MTQLLKKLAADRKGATAVEYGLIAALIAVAIVGAATDVGTGLKNKFGDVAKELGVTPK